MSRCPFLSSHFYLAKLLNSPFCRNLPFSYNRHLSSFPSLSPHLSFCQTFDKFLLNPPFSQFANFVKSQNCQYCWSALDVTAPMLMVKNKSIWEPNSIFMLIIREKLYCIDAQHCRLVSWLQTRNASFVVSFKIFARPLMNPNSPISQNLSFS